MIIYLIYIILVLLIIISILSYNITTKNKKVQLNLNHETDVFLKIKKTFDEIIKTKMNYYLISDFLPNFVANKEINKTLITKTKEKFYTDIMTTTPKYIIVYLQNKYTIKGLDLYILQYFFLSLNNYDFKNQNIKDIDVDDKDMNNILDLAKV